MPRPTIPDDEVVEVGEGLVSEPMTGARGERSGAGRVRGAAGLRLNAWNLLLLVPFLMLVTPWINSLEPRLFGMPFFYWIQFAYVPVGVACVAVVYVMTRDEAAPVAGGTPPDVDELDEGTAGTGVAR